VDVSYTNGDAIIAVRIAFIHEYLEKGFAMRKFLVAFGVLAMASASHAGRTLPISTPTMGEFALAALAVAVGIAATRFIKKK
jgi:hypothetical protein